MIHDFFDRDVVAGFNGKICEMLVMREVWK